MNRRPPCPSPTPGVHPNPCPSSRWCYPTISSSVVPFSFCLLSFPASGSFPMSQLFSSGGWSIGVSASTSVLSVNTQDWSLGWTGWTRVGSLSLHQGIFLTQGWNWGLLHCRWILYQMTYQGSPKGDVQFILSLSLAQSNNIPKTHFQKGMISLVCGIQRKKDLKSQPWIFIGRTHADAEAPILWPPDAKSWLIGKDPDAGKDWRQEEKGVTEDEMVGWHHWLNGHEFEQTLGDSEGWGSLVCCSPRSHKEWDTTEWLNNNSNKKDKKELNSKAEGDSGTQKQIYGYQRGNGEGSVRR